MKLYSVAVLYKKNLGQNQIQQSLRLCHVEAENEDEATGKALTLISKKDKSTKDMAFELPVVLEIKLEDEAETPPVNENDN